MNTFEKYHSMKQLLVGFGVMLISITGVSQDRVLVNTKSLNQQGTINPNCLLWEIQKPEEDHVSYLFGIIHLISKEDYFLSHQTQKVLDSVKQIVFEIDMNEINRQMGNFSILRKMYMPNKICISDLVDTVQYSIIENYFNDKGIPFVLFKRMKPIVLASMVGNEYKGLSSENFLSYENELMKLAEEKCIIVNGLETLDIQLGLFDKIPYIDQTKILLNRIHENKRGSLNFDEVSKLYKSGNIDLMAKLAARKDGLGDYDNVLVADRNTTWLPIMLNKMKQSTLFAVGAGHLGGACGLIELLKQEGVKVTPIDIIKEK